jgi:hypothetical protein
VRTLEWPDNSELGWEDSGVVGDSVIGGDSVIAGGRWSGGRTLSL